MPPAALAKYFAAIPTFNQWGLAIFGLLTLNLGLIFIYRKNSI